MQSHNIDYKIIGNEMQIVEIGLDPGETVIAEAGVMNYMDEGITFEAKLGDGSEGEGILGKLFQAGKRMFAEESVFLTHFTNESSQKRRVAFSAPYPGKIIPVDLSKTNGYLLCQKDAFLCAAYGTKIDIAFTKRFGTGLFGGEGFILEKLSGDGLVFIHAGGTVIKKKLNNGEKLRVDTGCIVAFDESIDYSIEKAGGLKSMLFGGEGLFLATLSGAGEVYLQSLPFSRLADRIIENAPTIGGDQKGEGSILGGLGRLIDGDY